jgi:hypothetical protein
MMIKHSTLKIGLRKTKYKGLLRGALRLIPHKRFLKSNYSKIMAFSAPNMGDWTKAWHVVAYGCNTDMSMSTEYGAPNSTLIELYKIGLTEFVSNTMYSSDVSSLSSNKVLEKDC